MDLQEFCSAIKEALEVSRLLQRVCDGDVTCVIETASLLKQLGDKLARIKPDEAALLPKLAAKYPTPVAPIDGLSGASYHEIALRLARRVHGGLTMASYGDNSRRWPTVEKRLFHNWPAVQKWMAGIPTIDGVSVAALLDDEAARGRVSETSETQDAPQWSAADSPKRWAKVFGVSVATVKRRFRDGKIRNNPLSDRSYQVDLRDIPKNVGG